MSEHTTQDDERDEALKETFPASDPPAVGGTTGPEDGDAAPKSPAGLA